MNRCAGSRERDVRRAGAGAAGGAVVVPGGVDLAAIGAEVG